MTTSASIRVVGVKSALAELNAIDKQLRRRITHEYSDIVAPIVNEAKYLVPARAPMSGWYRAWTPRNRYAQFGGSLLPWVNGAAGYRIKPYVSGKRPRTIGGYTKNLAAFGIRWTDKTAVLFDASGQSQTKSGDQMIKVLGERYGSPSRAMWRAYDQAGPDMQYELRRLVEKIMRSVGRSIKVKN
jgi:hypothetical protein